MQLSELVATSDALRATRSRKQKVSALADCFRALEPEEIAVGVLAFCGELRQGKIGVGWSALQKMRDVAPAAQTSLTLAELDAVFDAIAAISGKGANARRHEQLTALFERATAPEQHFLVRLVSGEIRQGAKVGLVVEGVAAAAGAEAAAVRRAHMLSGDIAEVAAALFAEGVPALERFGLELFRPVLPMLAQPAADVAEALERHERSAFEWKLDGARVQVHKEGDAVRVYTRRLNEVTPAVPELVEAASALPVSRAILDGEVLALDDDGRPRPFQETMRRFGRRLDVEALRRELPLTTFFFDALLLDDRLLLDAPAAERIDALHERVASEAMRVPRLVTTDAAEAEAFYDAALEAGHEGLMAKSLDAPYEAGGRGQAWLKCKPAHTLDLVVLAAEWGSGRREGWLSNLHLGARDPETPGGFAMLGKTFKGMTDELLTWQTRELLAREVSREGHVVHVRPELVVEIAFSDVQQSPHYASGLALRFARVKGYRADKAPAEADSIDAVRAIASGATPSRRG